MGHPGPELHELEDGGHGRNTGEVTLPPATSTAGDGVLASLVDEQGLVDVTLTVVEVDLAVIAVLV